MVGNSFLHEVVYVWAFFWPPKCDFLSKTHLWD